MKNRLVGWLVALTVALAMVLQAAPAAAEETWLKRYHTSSDRDRVREDMVVSTTVKWESGTTKANGEGRPIVRPISVNFRGKYDDDADDCGNWHGGMEYATFKPHFHDQTGKNFYPLWTRVLCEDDGSFALTKKFNKRSVPRFRYAKGLHPQWQVDWKVVFNGADDKDGQLHGRMYWLGMRMPLTRHHLQEAM